MSTTEALPRGLRVAELAAAAGTSADTVRYYERAGLLHPPARTSSGYRVFPAETVERLRFIHGCQRLGLRLREIRDLLDIRDTGECPCEPAETLLSRRLVELDEELTRLTALRAELTHMVAALPSDYCPPPIEGSSWCAPKERG